MRRILYLVAASLTACGGSYTTPASFATATAWCQSHGGLKVMLRDVRSRDWVKIEAVCIDDVTISKVLPSQ